MVGEPKRGEIIAELKTHLDDLNNKNPSTLGEPKQLAKQYNQAHLGIFYDPRRLLWAPALIWLTMLLSIFGSYYAGFSLMRDGETTPARPDLTVTNVLFTTLIPVAAFLIGLLIIHSLSRFENSNKMIWKMAAILFGVGSTFFFLNLLFTGMAYGSIFTSLIFFIGVSMIANVKPVIILFILLWFGLKLLRWLDRYKLFSTHS